MEAVPRLTMLSFPLKHSPVGTAFNSLKKYIAECYQEDPDSFTKEVYALESLRNAAMHPAKDVTGCATLKRYYCQLHSLANRFPQVIDHNLFTFTWKDLYANKTSEVCDFRYEMAAVLFNVAGHHTQLGASANRCDTDGMKLACTHFQIAAWSYGELREKYQGINGNVDFMTPELLLFMQQVSLAHAQECILEKSLIDHRKPAIVAKVTAQVVNYYGAAMAALLSDGYEVTIADVVGSSVYKEWEQYVRFKTSYLQCILFLYQGQQAEEQQKMGERVALYQAAWDNLEEARKEGKNMKNQTEIVEVLTFTADIVEGSRKAAKNENEFIYHEAVPELKDITAVQGANLVNGINFSVTDPEVAGEDIFSRLIPMKVHEANSMYSEEKATLLRRIGTDVQNKNNELDVFMSSLNIDNIDVKDERTNKIPQGIVDRCASINAKPNSIPELISSMSNLAEICADVELSLNEIRDLLNSEEMNERRFQKESGVQRNNAHFAELTREFQKYLEAHQKAGDSNDTLRKAMELHVSNLRILANPLQDIQKRAPKLTGDINERVFHDLKTILNKINEMKAQRAQFCADLRIAINDDDITSRIVACGDDGDMKTLFRKEIAKHDKLVAYIDQNLKAQETILAALTEHYARTAPFLKAINDVKHKRDNFFSSLATSYDVYEDLLAKSAKGLEFYKKLQGNVQKLLARVKAACDVQSEERHQRMLPDRNKNDSRTFPTSSNSPKLKDYLKSGKISSTDYSMLPPVRPSPLGSEATSSSACVSSNSKYYTTQSHMPPPTSECLPPPYTPSVTYYEPNGYINPIYHNNQITAAETMTMDSNHSSFDRNAGYASAASIPNVYQTGTFGSLAPNHIYHDPFKADSIWYQYPNVPTDMPPSYSNATQSIPNTNEMPVFTPQDQSYQLPSHGNYLTYPQSNNYQQSQVQQPEMNAPLSSSQYSAISSTYPQQTTIQDPWNQMSRNFATLSVQNPSYPASNCNNSDGQTNSMTAQMEHLKAAKHWGNSDSIEISSIHDKQLLPQTTESQVASNTVMHHLQRNSQNQSDETMYPNENVFHQLPQQQQPIEFIHSHTKATDFYDMQQSLQLGQGSSPGVTQYQTTTIAPGNPPVTSVSQTYPSNEPNQTVLSASENYNNVPSGCQSSSNFTNSTPSFNQIQSVSSESCNQSTSTISNVPERVIPQTNTSAVHGQPKAASTQRKMNQKPSKNSPKIDLLTDNDFFANIPVPPLQPQVALSKVSENITSNQETLAVTIAAASPDVLVPSSTQNIIQTSASVEQPNEDIPNINPTIDRKRSCDNITLSSDLSSLVDHNFEWDSISSRGDLITSKNENKSETDAATRKAPDEQKMLKFFHKEVEHLEKIVESLNVKMLNGNTPLANKWKDLQDLLTRDEMKRTTSIARLFPEKNRFSDCIPFDHARVILERTNDDYINAAYVKNLGLDCPTFVLAQTPLPNTLNDFWSMIWTQKARIIVCLHAPKEIPDISWPSELNKEIHFDDFSLTLVKQFELSHCVELSLRLIQNGTDDILDLSLLQIKLWSDRSPDQVIGIAQNILATYKQRRQEFSSVAPLVINCLTGCERSGLIALAICAILATQSKRPILINVVDVWYRICSQRRSALRDTNNFELSMQVVLNLGHELLNKRGIMTSYQMRNIQKTIVTEKEKIKDPFDDIDPLWKLKSKTDD